MVSFKSYNINKYRNKLIDKQRSRKYINSIYNKTETYFIVNSIFYNDYKDKHNNIIKGCYIIK